MDLNLDLIFGCKFFIDLFLLVFSNKLLVLLISLLHTLLDRRKLYFIFPLIFSFHSLIDSALHPTSLSLLYCLRLIKIIAYRILCISLLSACHILLMSEKQSICDPTSRTSTHH